MAPPLELGSPGNEQRKEENDAIVREEEGPRILLVIALDLGATKSARKSSLFLKGRKYFLMARHCHSTLIFGLIDGEAFFPDS